jgi:transcriptional regulator of acetoin/glycerol metabolism
MSSFLLQIRRPVGTILPLDEVKRRAIVDALDKCQGNYRLAARLLGIGKTTVYRMARQQNHQLPQRQEQQSVERFAT